MDEFIKLLDEHLNYMRHEITGDTIVIYVESNRTEVICPYCGTLSSKRHSFYERSFQDLPLMGKKTKLIMKTRKMFCFNPDCNHSTFAEKYDFLAAKSRKTKRLLDKILDVSLNVSSLTAADILRDGIADVGKSTICNLLKKRDSPSEQENNHEGMY